MSAIEEIGLTREGCDKLYDENNGFNGSYNINHPLRKDGESVYEFVRKGAEKLVKENHDLVDAITEVGTYNGDY